MKRLILFCVFVCAGLLPLYCSSQLSTSESEELLQIVKELKSLNDEQLTIIQNSKKRNEELERLSKQQEQQIESLTELSENRQKIITEQKQTIDELQSCSKEQKKSSIKTIINSIIAAALSFLIGCAVGIFFI